MRALLGTLAFSLLIGCVQIPSPAAPPPPPPAVLPVRLFWVLFDANNASINVENLDAIREATKISREKSPIGVSVEGYAGDNETAPDDLSLRRAQTVRDEMIREGIPASAIVAIGRGSRPVPGMYGPIVEADRRCVVIDTGPWAVH
jgi:OmpA-OmpF porin, OOP family